MKGIGIIGTAALSLLLGVAAPTYSQQDQNDQQQEQKKKADEKKAPEDKSAKQNGKTEQQQDKNAKPEEKKAQQQDKNPKQEERTTQQTQRAPSGNHGGRIPDDRFRASFGREHSFRVSQADYSRDRRFQYGGYSFGFVDAWPTNWLYTQDVFVVEIDGVYYLCNPAYPGVNVTLSIAD